MQPQFPLLTVLMSFSQLYMSRVSPQAKLLKSVKWFFFNLPETLAGKVRDTSGEEM